MKKALSLSLAAILVSGCVLTQICKQGETDETQENESSKVEKPVPKDGSPNEQKKSVPRAYARWHPTVTLQLQ